MASLRNLHHGKVASLSRFDQEWLNGKWLLLDRMHHRYVIGKSNASRGLTLLEILVVMTIITLVGASGVFFGVDMYRGYSFHSDRDMLVVALQHARAQAVGNVCLGSGCTDGRSHGVAILPNAFIAFQGVCFASPCVRDPHDSVVDATLDANPNIAHGGSVSEIVFSQLAATTTGGTITLTDITGRSSTITIGTEGQIIWTN